MNKMPSTFTKIAFWVVFCASSQAMASSPVRVLLQENRLEEATTLCRQFEVLPSPDKDNTAACAWVFFRIDKTESGEHALEKVKKLSPGPEAQLLVAFNHLKRKRYESARQTVQVVLEENKTGPVAIAAQELNAEIYEAQGQLDTAAFIYKQVTGEDASRARAHWGLGRYYLSKMDTGRAKSHLETVAKLWPKHLGSRYNLAVLSLQSDNTNEAARWLGECYKINRADSAVLEQLGVLFEKKGMISEAIRYWQRALDLGKDAPTAREKLSLYVIQVIDALIEGKQYEKALAQMQLYGKGMGKEPKFLLRRGLVNRHLGKFKPAAQDLLAYTQTNPKDALAIRELGVCFVNLKLWDQANQQFVKGIELEPENGLNYAWLAYSLEAKGKLPEAYSMWKQSVQYLKDPEELQRANRRISVLERRIPKQKAAEDRELAEEADDNGARTGADGFGPAPQIPKN